MKTAEIRSEADFEQLRTGWDQLMRQAERPTIFLTWEWMSAWWSAYGTSGELWILTFSDDNDVLRGIAPLRSQRIRKYGQSVPAFSFVGDGSYDSDYLDFIAAAGYEKQVIEAFCARCAQEVDAGAVLLLNEVPELSPNYALLKRLAGARGLSWKETDVPCATVRLPGDWDAYLRMLQPRFRTKVRSVLRNLESRPEAQFRFCDAEVQLERILPALFDLHTRRWAGEGKPGVFGWEAKRDFYFRLSRVLLERDWLRLSWLEWNGQVLACQYGFVYGGTYFQLQEGYEPASEHWNVGVGLRAWSIRELLKEGLREYDFLGGVGKHKTTWGAEVKHSKRVVMAASSYKNFLFMRGPEWETAGREWARKLVPEKILAARQARLGTPAAGKGVVQEPWLRHTAAACYFRSGLPGLTRRWRDRYELSIGENGAWPGVSWKKRQQVSSSGWGMSSPRSLVLN